MKVTEITKMNETEGGERMKRLIKNNKGFSLVELLIVIAIMGVLAVIAFNMFGGVLTNSKKRADDQQAQNIEKGILTYCMDANDWTLENARNASLADIGLETKTPIQLIQTLMKPVYNSEGKEFGPYFSPKDPDKEPTEDVNTNAYSPQYRTTNGGTYVGWGVTIYSKSQVVKVVPVTTSSSISVLKDK